jgi:hypothetical protein
MQEKQDFLEKMYLEGESNTEKYTAEEALKALKNMKSNDGRRMFGPNISVNPGGNLPHVDYIKSWFSLRKKRNPQILDHFASLSTEQLKQLFEDRFGPCKYEAKLIETDDLIQRGVISRDWEKLSVNKLKDELKCRKLPST